jgi:hypothetical protein
MFFFFPLRDEMRHIADIVSSSGVRRYIGHPPMVRPFERIINIINLNISDMEHNSFSHFVNYAGFLSSIVLVFDITKRIFKDRLEFAMLAGLLFVTHPVNVASVYRIDTISQQYATVFSLLFFRWLLINNDKNAYTFCRTVFLFSILIVLSKETALGRLIGLPFCAYLIRHIIGSGSPRKQLVNGTFTVLIVVSLYLITRQLYAGYMHFTYANRYHLDFSISSISNNIILFCGSLGYMGNTVNAFLFRERTTVMVDAILTFVVFGVTMVGFYILIKQHDRTNTYIVFSMLLLIFFGTIPVVLITKINELYSYGASPYFSILTALVLHTFYMSVLHKTSNVMYKRLLSYALISCFTFLIIWLGYSSYEKMSYANESSSKGKLYYDAIMKGLGDININGSVCINQYRNFTDKHYNFFIIPDDDMVDTMIDLIRKKNKIDIKLTVQDHSESCRYLLTAEESLRNY